SAPRADRKMPVLAKVVPTGERRMAITVADQFAETLVAAGVKRVYGIVGDSLNGLTDSLRRQGKIEWVHVRHEEVAAFAAGAEAHAAPSPPPRRSRRPRNALGRRHDRGRASLRRAPAYTRFRAARDTASSAAPAARAAHSHPLSDPTSSAIISIGVGSKAGQSKGTRMPKQIRI